jgi:hypothetical protein
MRRSKRFALSAGVALIALGTVAALRTRPEMKESAADIAREAAAETGEDVGAGRVERMNNVDDRGEQMPGRVLENILDLVAGTAEPGRAEQETSEGTSHRHDIARDTTNRSRDSLSSVTERVDSRGGDFPRDALEDFLGDPADLPDPPIASDDAQVSSGSTPREPSPLVPEDPDNNSDRYVPPNGNQPSDTVDRIPDEWEGNLRDLLDGILGPTGRSSDPGYHV